MTSLPTLETDKVSVDVESEAIYVMININVDLLTVNNYFPIRLRIMQILNNSPTKPFTRDAVLTLLTLLTRRTISIRRCAAQSRSELGEGNILQKSRDLEHFKQS